MLLLQEDDDAGTLAVVGGGDGKDDVIDNLLDALVGDGGGVVELVDGAAVLDGIEERLGGGHCAGDAEVAGISGVGRSWLC